MSEPLAPARILDLARSFMRAKVLLVAAKIPLSQLRADIARSRSLLSGGQTSATL